MRKTLFRCDGESQCHWSIGLLKIERKLRSFKSNERINEKGMGDTAEIKSFREAFGLSLQ